MKNRITWSILAASLTLFTACGGSDSATPLADGAEVTVPSQDEADMAAEDAITEENADEELDKLMGDIGE
ncbi:MAG: hypothetical protein ACJAZ8_002374 [Planctomycetota bacterium]|jgi:hypothetical protein